MALKVVHLLALLILGYLGITLEIYWILDGVHANNGGQEGGRSPKDDASNDAQRLQASAAVLLRGEPKGAVEQELVKKFAKVDAAKPVNLHGHSEQKQNLDKSSSPAIIVEKTRRFPEYGTKEYFAMCPYMHKSALPPPSAEGCSLIIHPHPTSNEGLAAWASSIVQGHLISRSTGCRFMFDYGPGVKIDTLITPPAIQSINTNDWSSQVSNWVMPPNFQCERSKCMELKVETVHIKRLTHTLRYRYDKSPTFDVPPYRYSYNGLTGHLGFNATQFDVLQSYLPGWDVRLGAACSMQMLFQPSKDIAEYEPSFFRNILPRLRDEKTLVLSLYVRVGFADKAAHAETKGKEPVEVMKGRPQQTVDSLTLCATALEEEILAMNKRYAQEGCICLQASLVLLSIFSFAYRTVLTFFLILYLFTQNLQPHCLAGSKRFVGCEAVHVRKIREEAYQIALKDIVQRNPAHPTKWYAHSPKARTEHN